MFAWQRFNKDAKQMINRYITAIPEIIQSNTPPDYEKMVIELEEDFYKELSHVFGFFQVIKKEEIGLYETVLAVRFFAGKDEDFYIIFGHEVFVKKDRRGRKWYTFTKSGKKYYMKGAAEGSMPELMLTYCGCAGDVNVLKEIDCEKVVYLTI